MQVNGVSALSKLLHKDQLKTETIKSVDFGAVLDKAITTIDQAERTAQTYDNMVATGEVENLHDAMIAAQKAEIVLNYGLEIRNQVLEAYRELMRIQF